MAKLDPYNPIIKIMLMIIVVYMICNFLLVEVYEKDYDHDVIKDKNNIIAIKIDVEGFELSVLQGITNLIKNNRIFLQIEIFDWEFSKTSSFLKEHNFKLLERGTYTHQETVKDYFYINF